MVDIQILEQALSPMNCLEFARSAQAGAVDIFIGTVRDQTQGRRVTRLEYEAYIPMAINEMHKIATQAMQRWQVEKIAIHHRIGTLAVGDIAVVVALSTFHRAAAFEACQFVIDTLKQTVPIWKKEVFEDGASWVAAHP